MKTLSYFFALFFICFESSKAATNESKLFQQLIKVNEQWSNQPGYQNIIALSEIRNVETFNEWIAQHLMLVEQTLRARNTKHLSAAQVKNRLQLLDELNGYWQAGIFPVNDYLPYKNPVFIDRKGTHCAVGYLMRQSGYEALAKAIDAKQKFAYVHDIKIPGVKEWAQAHGFTIDELAWIQPGYPPAIDALDMNKGFDGNVNAIAIHASTGYIYAAGDFSQSTKGQQCNNIAVWISGFAGYDWISVEDGVNGTVHALMVHNDKLYVGGEFTMAGSVSAAHIAVYDIYLGQWQAMGSLDSTVRAFAVYNNEVYAGGDFTGFVSKWTGSTWQDIAQGFIYGEGVRTLEVWDNKLVIGGSFELGTGALRKHVAVYDGTYMGNLGFGTLTPVNDFEIHENKLYAACDFVEGTDTCALAVFDTNNSEWQVAVKPQDSQSWLNYLSGNAFLSLLSDNDNLLIAGDFNCSSGMTDGNNLLNYTSVSFPNDTNTYISLQPLLTTDAPVNCIAKSGLDIYFGGVFTTNAYTDTLNHIGYIQLLMVGINNKAELKTNITAYPNPAANSILLQSDNAAVKIIRYEIYDAAGKLILHKNVNTAQQNISLQHFSSGIYTVKVSTANNSEVLRVMKY